MNEAPQRLNILQRINEVRKKIEYIQKDSTIASEGYKAVSHDAVTAKVRAALIEHGIVIIPQLQKSVVNETGQKTGRGTPWIRYEATYDINFSNIDVRDDHITLVIEAHAMDTGDKAPGKALSYAVKYAMLKLFNIETGEDDEERPSDVTGTMTPKEVADWSAKIDELASADQESVNKLWNDILEACKVANDPEAATRFRARLTAKAAALKKAAAGKMPQRKAA